MAALPLTSKTLSTNGNKGNSRMSDIPFNYAGTADNPIVWKDGMTAYSNFHYVRDGVRKVWTGENNDMPSWDDERFVKF